MVNSSLQVFSFLVNAKKIIESEKEDLSNIFKIRQFHYKSARKISIDISKRIYNELENHLYTYKDILIFMLYQYAFLGKVNIYKISSEDIKRVSKIFSKKQFKIDEDFILKINKNIKFKNIIDFFEIRESGEPIIYNLIKQNYITPVFYIKYYEKLLTNQNKDVILKSKNYMRFEYAMKMIIKIIKGGFK